MKQTKKPIQKCKYCGEVGEHQCFSVDKSIMPKEVSKKKCPNCSCTMTEGYYCLGGVCHGLSKCPSQPEVAECKRQDPLYANQSTGEKYCLHKDCQPEPKKPIQKEELDRLANILKTGRAEPKEVSPDLIGVSDTLCGCEADEQGIPHTIKAHEPQSECKHTQNGYRLSGLYCFECASAKTSNDEYDQDLAESLFLTFHFIKDSEGKDCTCFEDLMKCTKKYYEKKLSSAKEEYKRKLRKKIGNINCDKGKEHDWTAGEGPFCNRCYADKGMLSVRQELLELLSKE